MSQDCCHGKLHELERIALHRDIRRVLVVVLLLNALMFVVEFGAGLIAQSASLMADSIDMLGDAAGTDAALSCSYIALWYPLAPMRWKNDV